MLTVRPCTVKRARAWIGRVHRKLPQMQGAMWAVRVEQDGETVGVAAVGSPSGQWAEDGNLSVLRVAVIEGIPNACSKLYGACARAARAMGAVNLVTYTHQGEPGTSLRAAGWIYGGRTAGGEYDRPSRPRQPAMFPEPKDRWWAPWSSRVSDNTPPGGGGRGP